MITNLVHLEVALQLWHWWTRFTTDTKHLAKDSQFAYCSSTTQKHSIMSTTALLSKSSSRSGSQTSLCGQNVFSIIKTYESYTISKHNTVFLSIWQYRLAIGIMFSLRSSVRSFVTNFWTLYFEDEWTDFNADWHKSYPGARAWAVDLSHQEIKGKGAQEAWWRHHVRYLESSR